MTPPSATISPRESVISVAHKMLRDRFDVAVFELDSRFPARGISGYSLVSGLAERKNDIRKFFEEPCANIAVSLGSVSFEHDDLQSLLHTFEASSLGYALVTANTLYPRRQVIRLKDLLTLYSRGIFTSDLRIRDVASYPVATIEKETRILDVLREMLKLKVRRFKIAHSRWELVSDGDVLQFAFQHGSDGEGYDNTAWVESQLLKPLSELKLGTAQWVESDSSLEEAARVLLRRKNACALSQAGIVTPSDLILKPWRLGRLVLHW
jgi:CBS domain-containing protein